MVNNLLRKLIWVMEWVRKSNQQMKSMPMQFVACVLVPSLNNALQFYSILIIRLNGLNH